LEASNHGRYTKTKGKMAHKIIALSGSDFGSPIKR
jgi:hypothetical protein